MAAFRSVGWIGRDLLWLGALVPALLCGLGCSHSREAEPLSIERLPPPAPLAPPTIGRAALDDVLQKGPGRFFERMPVVPYKLHGRFVGFQVVQLYGGAPPHPEGLHAGDVVSAVNGMPVSRPDEFMQAWKKIHGASSIEVDVIRRDEMVRVVYRIVD